MIMPMTGSLKKSLLCLMILSKSRVVALRWASKVATVRIKVKVKDKVRKWKEAEAGT